MNIGEEKKEVTFEPLQVPAEQPTPAPVVEPVVVPEKEPVPV